MQTSTRPSSVLAPLYPLLFVALWSTGFIGAKFGLPDAEPLTFLSLRYALVLVLMGLAAWLMRAPWPRTAREWLHIGVSGLLVHAVYLGGVFIAIGKGLPAGVTALVVGLQPVLTALGAGAFLGERVRSTQWAGLALGFAGVGLVVAHKLAGSASGAVLCCGPCCCRRCARWWALRRARCTRNAFARRSICARVRWCSFCPAWRQRCWWPA
jgi:drug/metabolite transporter (DMT)-like permease